MKKMIASAAIASILATQLSVAEDILLPDGIHTVQKVSSVEKSAGLSQDYNTTTNTIISIPDEPVIKEENKDYSDSLENDLKAFDIDIIEEDLSDIDVDISKLDLTPRVEMTETPVYSDDLIVKYANGVSATAQAANTDALSIINHYMEKCDYIPLKDPKWVLALGSIEYAYYPNRSDIIFSWPIDINTYKSGDMLSYDYNYVKQHWGTEALYHRTGGAIGPFQCESFFGEGVSPVIPEEFGLIGTDGSTRKDCWIEVGSNPPGGTDITWKAGTHADRWSIADASNQILGVYNETMRRTNHQAEIYNMSKYEQAVLLMWGHNYGTGIINQQSRIDTSKEIAKYRDEIYQVISRMKPDRFSRQAELMTVVDRICDEVGCPQYPVMGLVSYMIVEARYNGEW